MWKPRLQFRQDSEIRIREWYLMSLKAEKVGKKLF
jgi:hypothetical protein